MKFLKCEGCGKIVELIVPSACPTKCCGEAMVELVPNTTDGAHEKHVPVVTREGSLVHVAVGSAEHPMMEKHWINLIAVETDKGVQHKELKPGDAPKADFALCEDEELKAVYEYCNLHGLWKAEL